MLLAVFIGYSLSGFLQGRIERNDGHGSGVGFYVQRMALARVSASTLADDNACCGAEGDALLCKGAILWSDQHIPLPVLIAAVQKLRNGNLRQIEQKTNIGPCIGALLQVPAYPAEFHLCYPIPHVMRSRNDLNNPQYQHGSETACNQQYPVV